MKYLYTDLFNEFECIGGECPETCCGTWAISVDNKSYEKYDNLSEPDRSWILDKIEETETGHRFKLNDSNNMCPFLSDEGWCLMYRRISPDILCDTCRYYPRIISQYNDLITCTVSLSCPHVGKLMLKHNDSIQFTFNEDEISNENNEVDWTLFNELINGWITVVNVLQNRTLSLKHRLLVVLDIANIIDTNIDKGQEIRKRIENYLKPDTLVKRIFEIENSITKITNYGDFVNSCFDIIKSTRDANINSIFGRIERPSITSNDEYVAYKKKYDTEVRDNTEYEHIAVQLLFEEWMKTINGNSLYVVAVRIILYLLLLMSQEMYFYNEQGSINDDNKSLLISRLSRVLEHSSMVDILTNLLIEKNGKESVYSILDFFEEG